MGEIIRLGADQLADADLDRLFGRYPWYPGAPAMRKRLVPAELLGYRRDGLQGVIGLTGERDQVMVEPWTPAIAAGLPDEDAVALELLERAKEAARAMGTGLLSIIRDREGSRARTQARWLLDAGFPEVNIRVLMARDLADPPSLPDRPGLSYQSVPDPAVLADTAQACYAGSLDPLAAQLSSGGWLDRLRQLREDRLGPYLPRLSELLRLESRPAGFYLATDRGPALRFPAGWVYLADMGIIPELRGQGLGALLLGRFLARSREHGYDRAWLTVDDRNSPAQGLYRKSDFRPLELVAVGRWNAGSAGPSARS